ncbi:SurA N-terminal domain-containing protein [Sulfurimonas sp. SAG-AH-194-I05]|nr:SurA N-terminal domain-containing protein [Sulfurimonas sp. SAG-AH-194-I05]MDF1874246.1 SurA N-terminal domain-containing protein [Sulfurimonas sp. SAG-AH-194-I05]
MNKFLISLLCVAGLNAQMIGGVAVVVNDKAITLYDIKKEMQSSQLNEKQATDALIRQKLEEVEIKKRKITVATGDIYDDIKATAQKNNMSVNDFYAAALNNGGLNSEELKEKIKQKLLSKKLYDSISYAKLTKPSESELKVYYELNKKSFYHPSAFTVVIYQTVNKAALVQKVQNPMFYSPQIQQIEQVLPYDRISPQLAGLLERTKLHTFTPIVPDGKGGSMSFYMKAIQDSQNAGYEKYKVNIMNEIMQKKRELALRNHFRRVQDNANIVMLRTL